MYGLKLSLLGYVCLQRVIEEYMVNAYWIETIFLIMMCASHAKFFNKMLFYKHIDIQCFFFFPSYELYEDFLVPKDR